LKREFFSLVKDKEMFTDSMDSDFIIVIGVMPSFDEQLLSNLKNRKNIVYLSVIEDREMVNIASLQSRYEAGSEEGVLAILAKELLKDKELDKVAQNFFENLDDGYISAESNVGEEELEEIFEMYKDAKRPLLVLGYDLYNHPRVQNIVNIVNLLVEYGNFKIFNSDQFDNAKQNTQDLKLQDIAELESFDGTVVYTYPTDNLDDKEQLIGSPQFMMAAKVKEGDELFVITQNSEQERKFVLDRELKGTVALLPSAKGDESYYYKIAKIIKREN